jgi:integrase
MAKRERGTGSVIKLNIGKDANGDPIKSRYWYILFYHNGRKVRESSESESKMVAEKLLQRRMGEMGLGLTPEQDVKRVKYEQVRDAWFAEHKNQGRYTYTRTDGTQTINGLDHLDKFFKGVAVVRIDADMLRSYIESRRKAGIADPTIRRNLVMLRSMLNMARKEGKLRLVDIPHFPMPKDSSPRTGFVNPDVFGKLLEELPKNLRPLITFVYYTGCRKGAALKITWSMVNKECTEILLPGEITKSGQPLTLPLVGTGLKEVSVVLRKMFRKDGQVFDATNLRVAWNQACHKLGLGVYEKRLYKGLTIHDLRRSAARNLIRAGVPRGVAMQITGHKTEAVFERYNITDTADVKDALVKVGQYVKLGGK